MFSHFGDGFGPPSLRPSETDSPQDSPRTVPSARRLPKIIIPWAERSRTSTPASSPFPRYRDDSTPGSPRPPSLHLPPAITSPESLPISQSAEEVSTVPKRPLRWWPYTIMPPPGVIISTLFPTIYHWGEKTWWEKSLGVVAAPSVFLLTVTLPVVENDRGGDEDESAHKNTNMERSRSKSLSGVPAQSLEGLKGVVHDEAVDGSHPGSHRHTFNSSGLGRVVADIATSTEQHQHRNSGERHASFVLDPAARRASTGHLHEDQISEDDSEPELWNRWLTILQLFLAPLLIAFAIWSQSPSPLPGSWILKTVLISLATSTVLLLPLLYFSTPTHQPPAFRTLLSLAGFLVSIAWISTIAAQVVGALKALAVILNMSHAIMGLTIFAVGNSLGDLVADVTVARLGYPIMALSACFGGPMLNILLGIGLSGSWILIRGADKRHARHPDQPVKYKSYQIEVSTTLVVSGATLLVTLVGLLVAVPLNKWVLDRRIGWTLIGVWAVSTIGNVVVECTGWGVWGSE